MFLIISLCFYKTNLILDGKSESAILRLSNGSKCTLKCWKECFPKRFEYCKNVLENNSLKNIIAGSINEVFKNAFC